MAAACSCFLLGVDIDERALRRSRAVFGFEARPWQAFRTRQAVLERVEDHELWRRHQAAHEARELAFKHAELLRQPREKRGGIGAEGAQHCTGELRHLLESRPAV